MMDRRVERGARLLVRALTRGVAALAALAASSCGTTYAGEAVIPPGQEKVLLEIFGTTGGCTFDGGQIGGSSLTVEYACPTGRVSLRISHARDAADIRTQQFAIVVSSGTPPPGFLEAMEAQVRSREAAFAWHVLPWEQPRWVKNLRRPGSEIDVILHTAVIVLPTLSCLMGLALLVRMVLRYRRRTVGQS